MTDDQLKILLASEYILKRAAAAGRQSRAGHLPHAREGYHMTFNEMLGLWVITGSLSMTHVAAADVISLQFSNSDKVEDGNYAAPGRLPAIARRTDNDRSQD